MKLKSIHINRGYTKTGALRGEVEFFSDSGTEIKIPLDEELSTEVVELCANAIARAGSNAATLLTSEANQIAAIEHQD